jgi:hypothetical protein
MPLESVIANEIAASTRATSEALIAGCRLAIAG